MSSGIQMNAFDPNSLGDLKRLAREKPDDPETLRAASKQFEAMFLQMALKAMREATPASSMFDSEQSRTYQSLLDQQLALNMAHSNNNGMSEALFRQLGGVTGRMASSAGEALSMPGSENGRGFELSSVIRQSANPAALMRKAEAIAATASAGNVAEELDPLGGLISRLDNTARSVRSAGGEGSISPSVRSFVDEVWPHAQAVSRQTGIPAQFIVAQAALESGWGEKVMQHADGRSSHNLFNIKAGSGWNGETVTRDVTEYAGTSVYTEKARFRSYGSYAEAFQDYARLLSNGSRYSAVLGQTSAAGFAGSLQKAGYATDPMYADKLTRIIAGNTLRTALSG